MIDSEFVQIAVEAPLARPLTYRLPKDLAGDARVGSRVKVPLGKRHSRGVVIGEASGDLQDKSAVIKPVESILTEDPPLGDKTLKWLKWLAQYYLHPPGQVYSLAFAPAGEERKRKSKKTSPTELGLGESRSEEAVPTPNPAQKTAIDAIGAAVLAGRFETFLLFGVTGSGKTEVYLRSIEAALAKDKQVLILVPEISLTPQLIKRFVRRFGDNVAVLHSHLTGRERADQWWSAVRKKKKLLIGARSALFCPLEDLGLVIVDEEHEASFKQEEQLKYNGRDSAIMRAQISGCPIVLGSATPSLESWANVQTHKYTLLELPNRVEDRPLPAVDLVDMRQEKAERDDRLPKWMSKRLFSGLQEVLGAKEQAAIFLNRRGFAQFVICSACGYTEQCPHCSVTLTVHRKGTRLECHYCGFLKEMPPSCPVCKQEQMKPLGMGTERVCEELQALFPEARIARADRDEINSRESLENLLDRINNHEVDVIVGTQMIAKGHDFPNLTLVGAILADVGLHFPDFRSSERTFQLLTQVAGRAGRHRKAGRVIIQSYCPEHAAIRLASTQDFPAFADSELQMRRELHYPPFGKLATIRLQGAVLPRVEQAADLAHGRITRLQQRSEEYRTIEVLGPCEAPLAKVRGKFRFHLMLKAPSSKTLNTFLQHMTQDLEWLPAGAKISFDVDPLQLL